MKAVLRIMALIAALTGAGYWFLAGHHTGWSMNRVPVEKKDPVTGQEYKEYEDRFVPGVDFLGGVFAGAGALLAISFFVRKK